MATKTSPIRPSGTIERLQGRNLPRGKARGSTVGERIQSPALLGRRRGPQAPPGLEAHPRSAHCAAALLLRNRLLAQQQRADLVGNATWREPALSRDVVRRFPVDVHNCHVRAMLHQAHHNILRTRVRGVVQRDTSPNVLGVHVCTLGEQQLHHFIVALLRGKVQSLRPVVLLRTLRSANTLAELSTLTTRACITKRAGGRSPRPAF
jgi:hypothetical protein